MKKGLVLFTALLALVGCNSQKKNAAKDSTPKAQKYLVVYYSQTGATQQVAQVFARLLGADTLRIKVERPYDGTYQETIERCQKEMKKRRTACIESIEDL